MSDTKPIASLGPVLLARKGSAKPAMRGKSGSVTAHDQDLVAAAQEELGWNDIDAEGEPAIRRQQTDLVHRIADSNLAAFKASETSNVTPIRDRRRAAFTLRLDAERHLKLKLAATVRSESAQQLVTRALDQMLADMPEIENLATQVKRGTSKA